MPISGYVPLNCFILLGLLPFLIWIHICTISSFCLRIFCLSKFLFWNLFLFSSWLTCRWGENFVHKSRCKELTSWGPSTFLSKLKLTFKLFTQHLQKALLRLINWVAILLKWWNSNFSRQYARPDSHKGKRLICFEESISRRPHTNSWYKHISLAHARLNDH